MSLVALAVLAAAPAAPPRDAAPPGVARQVGAAFADCLWRGNREKVRRMLEEEVDGEHMRVESLDLGHCSDPLAGTARFPAFVLRGLLFERMYHADFDGSPVVASFEAAGPAGYPVAPRSVQTEGAKNYRGLMRIADCVVRNAPVQARALLATSPATHGEARALSAVEPLFRSCQAPLAPLPFSAEMMRGTVAESLFRLSRTSGAAGPARGRTDSRSDPVSNRVPR
jgi:hypothetical protein